jgi:hypothetical protein
VLRGVLTYSEISRTILCWVLQLVLGLTAYGVMHLASNGFNGIPPNGVR